MLNRRRITLPTTAHYKNINRNSLWEPSHTQLAWQFLAILSKMNDGSASVLQGNQRVTYLF